jgi:hypothetical protein
LVQKIGQARPGSEVQNLESVSSHETAEIITDADVGFANGIGFFGLAWYDPNYGEIGDYCNQQEAPFMGYTVQKLWSNMNNACVVP